jgi:hypothetical protein
MARASERKALAVGVPDRHYRPPFEEYMVEESPKSQSASAASSGGVLFVVGLYRSGTSLLFALLNRHPAIALMYEAEVQNFWPILRLRSGLRGWAGKLDFWNGALSRHGLDPGSFSQTSVRRAAAADALYRAVATPEGACWRGEKSPSYYDRLPALAAAFPAARFVILRRDLADICRSVERASAGSRFFAKCGMKTRMVWGQRRLVEGVARLRADGRAVQEVVYEDLVQHPEAVLRGLCDFLDVPYSAEMLALDRAELKMLPEGGHHAGVRSGAVSGQQARPEVLPPHWVAKLNRYRAFWGEGGSAAAPSVWERGMDEGLGWLLRGFDLLVQGLFALVPIGLWSRYRAWRARS